MNRPKRIAIIGGGGIACALLPILSRLAHCVIVDGDVYEKANSTRQFPALTQDGNKAEVLAEMLTPNTTFCVDPISEYLEDLSILNHPYFNPVDLLIGAVDNNTSRHTIMEVALTLGIPAFLGGNESEHGEAHAFLPGVYDPCLYHDFSTNDAPPPYHCNTDKAIEENPQGPIANALAAGAILHLLSSYERVENLRNMVVYSRLDPLGSRFNRVVDYEAVGTLAAHPELA